MIPTNNSRLNNPYHRQLIDNKYKPEGCKHTPLFDNSTIVPIGPKIGGANPGFTAYRKHSPDEKIPEEISDKIPKNLPQEIEKRLCIVKPGLSDHGHDPFQVSVPHSLINRKAKLGAILEYTAATLFKWLSANKYLVAKTKLGNLQWFNEYTQHHSVLLEMVELINKGRPESNPLTSSIHLISYKVVGYRNIAKAKVKQGGKEIDFMDYVKEYKTIPEKIIVDNQEIPLEGLPELLAIGKLLHDIDIMGSGSNVGFVVQDTPNGKIAKAVKIDPGCSFHIDEGNKFIALMKKNSRRSFFGTATILGKKLDNPLDIQINTHDGVIIWNNLSTKQKQAFLFSLYSGVQELKDTVLIKYLIWRNGLLEEKFGISLKEEDINNLIQILTNNSRELMGVYKNEFTKPDFGIRSYSDGKEYYGELKSKKAHGKGKLYYPNGTVEYDGDWENGERNGTGVEYRPDGTVEYNGEWNHGKRGRGRSYRPDGTIEYDGEWKDNQKHGKGTLYYLNGKIAYDGDWIDNQKHGKGTLCHLNGKIAYDGDWIDGKIHGKSILYRRDGTIVYDGNWNNGKRNGTGTSYRPDGSIEYNGNWKDDKVDGEGKSYYPNGRTEYAGNYKDGKRHGVGTLYHLDDRIDDRILYNGNWENGQRHGNGIEYRSNGTILYAGDYKDGKAHGKGRLYHHNRKIAYDGDWMDGKRHGKGQSYYSNGTKKYDGDWEADKWHGKDKSYHPSSILADDGNWEDGYIIVL